MPSLLLNSILKRSKDSIKESLINESLACKRNFKELILSSKRDL